MFLYLCGSERLAPLYDLVSTARDPELSNKMAMMIGRNDRPKKLRLSGGIASVLSALWRHIRHSLSRRNQKLTAPTATYVNV